MKKNLNTQNTKKRPSFIKQDNKKHDQNNKKKSLFSKKNITKVKSNDNIIKNTNNHNQHDKDKVSHNESETTSRNSNNTPKTSKTNLTENIPNESDTHSSPKPKSNNIISKNETNNKSNIKEMNFIDAIDIINEIQEQFAKSVQNNKQLEEIKKIIGDNNLDIMNYIPLTDIEKNSITEDIEKSSELRIQNYNTVFNYIKVSLDDIQAFLENNENENKTEEKKKVERKKTKSKTHYENSKEQNQIKLKRLKSRNLIAKEITENIKQTKIENNKNDNSENMDIIRENTLGEDADFSAGIMQENALVLPPKSSPFNYQIVKDLSRMRSKKFSVRDNTKITKKINKNVILSDVHYLESDNEDDCEPSKYNQINTIKEYAQYIDDDDLICDNDDCQDIKESKDIKNINKVNSVNMSNDINTNMSTNGIFSNQDNNKSKEPNRQSECYII